MTRLLPVRGIAGLAGVLFFPWLRRRYGHEVLLIGIAASAGLLILVGFLVSRSPVWSVTLIVVSSFFSLGTLPLFWSVAMSRMSGLLAAGRPRLHQHVRITGSARPDCPTTIRHPTSDPCRRRRSRVSKTFRKCVIYICRIVHIPLSKHPEIVDAQIRKTHTGATGRSWRSNSHRPAPVFTT